MTVSPKTLKNLRTLTPEEAKENGRKGGLAAHKTTRARKTFKDIAKQLLEMQAPDKIAKKIITEFPELDTGKVTQRTVMLAAQLRKARAGNTKAFEVIRDTAGEKPIEQVETSHVFNKMEAVQLDGQALTFDVGEGVDLIDIPKEETDAPLYNIEEGGTYTPPEGEVEDE